MLHKIRLVLASLVSCAMIAGCMAGDPSPEEGQDEDVGEDVGTAEQQLPKSGYRRTYYTDSTRTQYAGYELSDCDMSHELEGEETNYYKVYRWSCPDNPFPFAPYTTCYDCVTYTYPDGSTVKSCTSWACG